MIKRSAIAGLALSASAFVALAVHEDYRGTAYLPTPNDVPTIGFGTTESVKLGDTITVTGALERALRDVGKFEGALKKCVTVPLGQNEYDAYISLAYNIGPKAFCESTLVKFLNQGEYGKACGQILLWNRQGNRVLPGLVKRRETEYRQCIGVSDGENA